MRILLATIGSRGDVQPYLALALGLQAAGHDIAVCTCPCYRLLIEGSGIDQPFWGRRVHELGAGPAPLPQKRLSADGLARAIGNILHRPSYARAADSLADAITREDGIAVAISAIEQAHRNSSSDRP